MSQYRPARRCSLDGFTFHSEREVQRYLELRDLFYAGIISGLVVHPEFPIVINGVDIEEVYFASFAYREVANGMQRYENVESRVTQVSKVYRLKKVITEVLYQVCIAEV